jgi:hypothetical protein
VCARQLERAAVERRNGRGLGDELDALSRQ